MKKSTRVLSMLLAFIMLFSVMSMSVSAAYTNYDKPGGYNSLNQPYLTTDQCGSMILDYLDAMLAKENITFSVDAIGIFIDLSSVDKALQSIINLFDSKIFEIGTDILNLKDIEKLDIYWVRQSPRRTTDGRTDLEVLYSLCKFLAANKTIVGKAVDGSLDIGFLKNFLDLKKYIGDIPGTLKAKVYTSMFNEKIYGPMPAGMTVDTMLKNLLQNMLVKDSVSGKPGLLPSMDGKLDVNNISGYQFIRNAVNALLIDFAKPKLTEVLIKLLGIDTTLDPNGVVSSDATAQMIWSLVFNGGLSELITIPYTEAAKGKPIKMLDEALDYILFGDFIKQYIKVTDEGLFVQPGLDSALHKLLIIGAGFVSGLKMQGVTFKTEAEMEAMSTSDLFQYVAKVLIVGFIDFADIPDTANTLREVATYLLANYAADILPEKNYISRIKAGEADPTTAGAIDPSTTGCLEVAAGLLRYYINANTEMNVPDNLTFEQTINHIVNWALKTYGGVICTGGMEADNAWKKLDKILLGNSPQLCGILQGSWLPTTIDQSNMIYDLLINKIIFSILDFNLDNLFSIFRSNSTGELNKSMVTIILNLVARILNGVFENNVIIPLNLTTIESIFTKPQLRAIVESLLANLTRYVEPICISALPLVVSLMGLWDSKKFDIKAPETTAPVSAEGLKTLMDTQVPPIQAVEYDQAGFVYFGTENYNPAYGYYDYMDTRKEASVLLAKLERDPTLVTPFELTNAAYRLTYYYNRLTFKQADITQLEILIKNDIAKGLVNKDYTVDPTSTAYTLRTWNAFKRAYAFADDVYMRTIIDRDPTITQAMVSEARAQLLKAAKSLKDYVGLADYSKFNEAMRKAKTLTDAQLNRYFESTVLPFKAVLNEAKAFPLDYDIDSSKLVDDMTEKINVAMAGLSFKPAIVTVEYSSTILDNINKLVYGLATGQDSYFAYVTSVGAGRLITTPTSHGNGTGTVISLVVDEKVQDSFTVAIIGDIDGDAGTDANDALIANLYMSGLLSSSNNLSAAQAFAADANGDGVVDANDVSSLEDAGLFLKTINQTPA